MPILGISANESEYIKVELAEKFGLKNLHQDPALLTTENYVRLRECFWFDDHCDYVHEGYRVDNATVPNSHSHTSARRQGVCQAKYKARAT